MTIFERMLIALGLRHRRGRVLEAVRYDRAECERALAEAERRLGLKYDGQGIRVTANPGVPLGGGRYGMPGTRIGAITTGGSLRQYVALYTDPAGREDWEELVHEMAHCVLWSRGRFGHPAEYRSRFIRWEAV